jgi:hypothetical protein
MFEDLDYPLEVALGGVVFITPNGDLLKTDKKSYLSVKRDDGVALLSAYFDTGRGEILTIENNELTSTVGHWDIETRANEIIIKSQPSEMIFHLEYSPPHRIMIKRIKTTFEGNTIDTEFSKKIYLKSVGGAEIHFASGFIVVGGTVTFQSENGIVIDGGAFILGGEYENMFGSTSMDYLMSQVKRLKEFTADEPIFSRLI